MEIYSNFRAVSAAERARQARQALIKEQQQKIARGGKAAAREEALDGSIWDVVVDEKPAEKLLTPRMRAKKGLPDFDYDAALAIIDHDAPSAAPPPAAAPAAAPPRDEGGRPFQPATTDAERVAWGPPTAALQTIANGNAAAPAVPVAVVPVARETFVL